MEEYIRGVKVKIRPSDEQKALFDQNFGCCRKAHNEVFEKYQAIHGNDYSKVPTKSELNKLLMEAKAEIIYLSYVGSTSLQQAVYDLQPAFRNNLKSKRHKPPIYHSKKKTEPSFRQTIRKGKKLVNGNILNLRVYGEVEIRTSTEYLTLLNQEDIKFNNITVTTDGLNYYATFNIEGGIRPEQLPLTGKHIGCDINSNLNGWIVTSNGQKEFFRNYSRDPSDKKDKPINGQMPTKKPKMEIPP
jgi:putative transposase